MSGNKRKYWIAAALALLVTVVAAVAANLLPSHVTATPALIAEKQTQLAALDELTAANAAFATDYNPQQRESTLRDSGRKGVGIYMRNAFFRVAGDIGFQASELAGLLLPSGSSSLVIMDDPTSFVFKPLRGKVVMPPSALAALFNQYLADYEGSQLRNLSVQTQADTLIVNGETSNVPGVWLPFHMAGEPRLADGHMFVFDPDTIEVANIQAKSLLKLVNLQVSSLLTIDTKGAELEGNAIVLDLNTALPPPRMQVQVSEMHIDDAGLHLSFTSDYQAEFPEPIVAANSWIMLQGGDVKTLRAVLTDVRMQMLARDGGALDISLYNYRQQLQSGLMDVTPAGGFVAYLGAFKPADYGATNDTQASENRQDQTEGIGDE